MLVTSQFHWFSLSPHPKDLPDDHRKTHVNEINHIGDEDYDESYEDYDDSYENMFDADSKLEESSERFTSHDDKDYNLLNPPSIPPELEILSLVSDKVRSNDAPDIHSEDKDAAVQENDIAVDQSGVETNSAQVFNNEVLNYFRKLL
mgnify:CR=1 FL=1